MLFRGSKTLELAQADGCFLIRSFFNLLRRHQLDVAAAVRQPHTESTRRHYAAEHPADIAVIAFRMEPGLRWTC